MRITRRSRQIRSIGNAEGHLTRDQLGHRTRLRATRRLGVVAHGSVQRNEPGRVHVGRHLGDLPLQTLVVGQRPSELPARGHVREGEVHQMLGRSHGVGGPDHATGVEASHPRGEAPARCSDDVIGRDAAVGEHDLGVQRASAARHRLISPMANPGVPRSTRNAVMPRAPWPGALVANTVKRSAIGALVM